MQKIVVLTGAGMSAESGISTFRDADGLWEGHDVHEVASPQGWEKNPTLVLDFYNQRRRQLKQVEPNSGHLTLVELEKKYEVVIVTQNVDNLHERAGSSHVLHLHGELTKARSTGDNTLIYEWHDDIKLGDTCIKGYQLRPHIVWFGELLPMLEPAISHCESGDIFIIIGTSMQVYPAAGLISYASKNSSIYYIDPKPNISYELKNLTRLKVIRERATVGVPLIVETLMKSP